MKKPVIHVYASLDELSNRAAARFAQIVEMSPSADPVRIVLAGGGTPRQLYRVLADRNGSNFPWDRIHLFWGDERYVPSDSPESNFATAREDLISGVAIPEKNVHPVRTDLTSPEESADDYERTLKTYFEDEGPELTILGLGTDGHTASLFPDNEVLQEEKRWVRAVEAPPYASPTSRITLTIPFLNRSRHVIFLASGTRKSAALHTVLRDPVPDRSPYPAGMIHARESTEWFVDEEAFRR